MLNLATQQNPVVVLLLGGGGVFCFLFPAFVPFWLLFWSPLTWNKNLESGGRSGSYQVSLHSGRAVVAANELFPEATTTTKKTIPKWAAAALKLVEFHVWSTQVVKNHGMSLHVLQTVSKWRCFSCSFFMSYQQCGLEEPGGMCSFDPGGRIRAVGCGSQASTEHKEHKVVT